MNYPTPRLEIFPERIKENAVHIAALCGEHAIQVAAVTKVISAHPAVVAALAESGASMLADARLENLRAMRQQGVRQPLMLLRLPSPSQADEVVSLADVSLNSSIETIRLLSEAAERQKRMHQGVLMVDLGDLREGVWPDEVLQNARHIMKLPGVQLVGLGSNLACYGGVIPTREKMQTLIDVRDECRRQTSLELALLSGGNSANLPLLLRDEMPAGINQLRVGEAIQLGRNVIDRSPFPGTRQDTYRLVVEVIELQRKPSLPQGLLGQDAFGATPHFIDRGKRLRAICAIGRQDVVIDTLIPEDPGILVLGGSSDHLILDVEDAKSTLSVGSEIGFWPGYSSVLAAGTSKYVHKIVMEG
jgi:predicted amino acid racemase